METSTRAHLVLLTVLLISAATVARADSEARHGPLAADDAFPSHAWSASPHDPARPQLAFHFGLLQPVLFQGMNAAIDLRVWRFVFSYSHGHALDYSATPELGLSNEDRAAGLSLSSPWTTGGGVGFTLVDELYVMLDVKAHRYEARTLDARIDYTTVSVGAELGYRLFAWKGLFVQPMLRFWPNVWTSLEHDRAQLGDHRHEAKNLGFFANLSIGWASSL
jgi:hypothetical protein